jgi:23S rRNA (adenine2503-C2)-methyltransferase
MGMGEPLLNYKNVMKSVEYITSPKALAMSPSRITVSTSGIIKQIKQLADDSAKFNLAVSLHASDNLTRSKMMPINDSNKIEDLIDALDYYFKKTKMPITYEYILFDGINDSDESANNLVKLCRRIPSKVNLIEYNTVAGTGFEKPTDKRLDEFVQILEQNKINVRVRRSRGKDIDAACGQLANKGSIN